jgi:TRAP-type C4-dicarboxylate transport system substrate-binding protein
MRFITMAAFIAAVLVSMSTFATSATAETRLLVNCFWPPQHFVCRSILPTWGKWVKEATDGRVRISIPPKSLAAPPKQWSAVESGIADVAPQFNGLVQNRITGPMVAMNPFIATADAEAMTTALWETYQQYFADEYKGVHLLSMWVITPAELYSQTDKPINSIDDLKSRKIWALPGTLANLMKKIESGVVAGPAVQANEIISRGVVDAHVGLSPTAVRDFRVIPYTSVSGAKFGRMGARDWMDADASALEEFKAAAIKVVDADPAFEKALIDNASPLTAAWIKKANDKGIDGQGAYDFYVKRIGELSK